MELRNPFQVNIWYIEDEKSINQSIEYVFVWKLKTSKQAIAIT